MEQINFLKQQIDEKEEQLARLRERYRIGKTKNFDDVMFTSEEAGRKLKVDLDILKARYKALMYARGKVPSPLHPAVQQDFADNITVLDEHAEGGENNA